MATYHDGDLNETTPLISAAPSSSTVTATATADSFQPPPTRPKANRSVTFNANPVSETFEVEPHYYHHNHHHHHHNHLNQQPNHYDGSSSSSSNSRPFPAGTPVLSSLHNKLRRRNNNQGPSVTPGFGSVSPLGHHAGAPGRFPPGISYHQGGMPPRVAPLRSTKNAQKLKILPNPDTTDDDGGATDLDGDGPASRHVYSQYTRIKDPSARRDAARLGKADRQRLPRVTAYCTASKYQMDGLMRFLNGRGKTRGANPRLIDECIYTPYNYYFGLDMAGSGAGRSGTYHDNDWGQPSSRSGSYTVEDEGRGVEQSGMLQEPTTSPDGDEPDGGPMAAADYIKQRSRSAQQHDGYDSNGIVSDNENNGHPQMPSDDSGYEEGFPGHQSDDYLDRPLQSPDAPPLNRSLYTSPEPTTDDMPVSLYNNNNNNSNSNHIDSALSESPVSSLLDRDNHNPNEPLQLLSTHANMDQVLDTEVHTPELFLFDYGVVVIWGMQEAHEERFLKELEKFEIEKLAMDEVQTELFNFYYTREYQPRIYNDFITLRDKTNYRTKLAISHGLAQSVKVSRINIYLCSLCYRD